MKKIIAAMLLTALMTLCLTAGASAACYVCFSGDCNVRSGPGLGYGQIGSVNRGSTLSYTGGTRYDDRGIAWYSVAFCGTEGWVSSVYASFTDRGGVATYGSGASGDRGTVFFREAGDCFVKAAYGDTKVRSGPGLGYAEIGVLCQGDWVEYAGDTRWDDRGIAWYAVCWGSRVAWVSSVYTALY